MASRFASRATIPDGFTQLLKDSTREILRNYPRDKAVEDPEGWIYQYAAKYFAELKANGGIISKTQNGTESMKSLAKNNTDVARAPSSSLSADELAKQIYGMFESADTEGTGALPVTKFQQVVSELWEQLQLPPWAFGALLEEADEDTSGNIAYEDYAHYAAPLLEQLLHHARKYHVDPEEARENLFVHGLTHAQFSTALYSIFQTADSDGLGKLNRIDTSEILRQSGLGITRQELNGLLANSTEDLLDYTELCQIAADTCSDCIYRLIQRQTLPTSIVDITQLLSNLLQRADSDHSGILHALDIRQLLSSADLSLSNVQLFAIFGNVSEYKENEVKYTKFIDTIAPLVSAAISVQSDIRCANELRMLREKGQVQQIANMEYDEFIEWLSDRIQAIDTTQSGTISSVELTTLLADELGLDISATHGVKLLSEFLSDESVVETGKIETQIIVDHAADIILTRQELCALADII